MEDKSYMAAIEVNNPPQYVFNHITDVSKWWGDEDFAGNSTKLGDEFTIIHGEVHYSKKKLVELVPYQKIIWLITDSKMGWLTDKYEWTNTRLIFEIAAKGNMTAIKFTHEGLVPELECHARCSEGWDMVIKERLYNFLTTNEGFKMQKA